MNKLTAIAGISVITITTVGFVGTAFFGLSDLKHFLGMEEVAPKSVSINKVVSPNAGELAPEANTDEIAEKETFKREVEERNDSELRKVSDRLNNQPASVFLAEKVLEYGAEQDSIANVQTGEQGCFTCPGISDEELEERVRAILGDKVVAKERNLQAVLLDDGSVAYLEGIPLFMDENGNFIDPVTGQPLMYQGKLLTKDLLENNPDIVLTDATGSKLFTNSGARIVERDLTEDELEGMTYNGQETYIDENGQLRYVDSDEPVLDENNETIFYKPGVGFVNAKGQPSSLGNKLLTKSGKQITAMGKVLEVETPSAISVRKLNKDDLTGLMHNGRKTYIDDNGQLRYVDNDQPVLDENNEEIFYKEGVGFVNGDGKASALGGKLTTEFGGIVTDGGDVIENAPLASRMINKNDLKDLSYNGRKTYVDKNGQLRYVDSDEPVLDENNEEIFYKEGVGFVNKDGVASKLGNRLKTLEGNIVTAQGLIVPPSKLKYQGLSEEQAKMLALKLKNTTEAEKASYATENRNQGSSATPVSLGNFYLSQSGELLSPDMEPLTISGSSNTIQVDRSSLTVNNGQYKWRHELNGWARDDDKPVYFRALQTKKLYTFDGKLVDAATLMLTVVNGELQDNFGRQVLYDGSSVHVDSENALYGAEGPIFSISGKRIYFDKELGLTIQGDVAEVDGYLTSKDGIAITHLGMEYNGSQKSFDLLSESDSVQYLPNSLLLRNYKPIYDRDLERLVVRKKEKNGVRSLQVENVKGTIFDNLSVQAEGSTLVLKKEGRNIEPVSVFVFDDQSNAMPFIKPNITLDLLGTGLYVSDKGYVFSDDEGDYVVLSNRMEPVRFDGRNLKDSKGIYKQIGKLTISDNPSPSFMYNVDGTVIFDSQTHLPATRPEESLVRTDGLAKLRSKASLWPNFSSTPPALMPELLSAAASSSGRLYLNNKVVTSTLGGILSLDSNQNVVSTKANDAPVLERTFLPPSDYDSYLRVNGGLLMGAGGLLKFEDFRVDRGRFIVNENQVLLLPQAVLVSFDGVLVSNGQIINAKYLRPEFTKDGIRIYGGLLADENGNLLKQGSQYLKMAEDGSGRVVNAINDKEVLGEKGALYFDVDKGFVDDRGRENAVILHSNAGVIDENGNLVKSSSLIRRPDFSKFLFDEDGNVYTDDGAPVRMGEKQIRIDEDGNVFIGDVPLEENEEPLKLTDDGISGGVSNYKIGPNGEVLQENMEPAKGLFDQALKLAMSPFDLMKDALNENQPNSPKVNADEERLSDNATGSAEIGTGVGEEAQPTTNQANVSGQQAGNGGGSRIRRLRPPSVVMLTESQALDLSTYKLAEVQGEVSRLSRLVNSGFIHTATSNVASTNPENNAAGQNQGLGRNGAYPESINFNGSYANIPNSNLESIEQKPESEIGDNQVQNDGFGYSAVTLVPEDAVNIFRKGNKAKAIVQVPVSTGNAGARYSPIIEITSGPLRGATIEGTVYASSKDITIGFDGPLTLRNGTSIATSGTFAVSIDPDTGYAGTGAEVDNHFFEKIFKLAPFVMLSKAGEWVELVNTQFEMSNTLTGIQENRIVDPPTPTEFAYSLAGEVSETAREIIQTDLDALTREIKLGENKEIEVVFVQDLYVNENDLYEY